MMALRTLGANELDGACAVLADMLKEAKGIPGRDLKPAPPPIEDTFVVGQESP